MERRGLPRGLPFAIRLRAFVTLVNSILLPLSRSLSVPGARPGSAIRQVFVFCGVVLNVYIRTDNMQHRKESLMPDDVATLGTQRSKLLEEFLSLGDLRPGSMTAVIRRCGKPSCHCAKHNVPGQEPQFRLTRRVAGKTVTESFADPTALRKAQQEVAEFHRSRSSARIWSPSTKRSVDSARSRRNAAAGRSRKKTAAAVHQEVAREVSQLLGRVFAPFSQREFGSTLLPPQRPL